MLLSVGVCVFLRNRALIRGRPTGAKGVGLRGGEEGFEEFDKARSEDVVTGAQSGSEASASSARCEQPPWRSEDTHSSNRGVAPLR